MIHSSLFMSYYGGLKSALSRLYSYPTLQIRRSYEFMSGSSWKVSRSNSECGESARENLLAKCCFAVYANADCLHIRVDETNALRVCCLRNETKT